MADKLYEVTLIGQFREQEIVNRWNYVGDGDELPSGNAFGLAQAMGFAPTAGEFPDPSIGFSISNLVSSTMFWTQCLVRAIYDPLDFVDLPYNPFVAGVGGTDTALSPINAFGFRTNRVRLDIGRGYKRFCGVLETQTELGGHIPSGVMAALTGLADEMSADLVAEEGLLTRTYRPVVVKKFRYTAPSGKPAYRYYTTPEGGEAVQMTKLAEGIEWQPYGSIRSQVSRQIGHGS